MGHSCRRGSGGSPSKPYFKAELIRVNIRGIGAVELVVSAVSDPHLPQQAPHLLLLSKGAPHGRAATFPR